MAILTLRPNADSSVQWARSTGSYNYALIDESVADDTDYVLANNTNTPLIDKYGLPNHTSESGTIDSVTVYARVKLPGDYPWQTPLFSLGLNDSYAATRTPTSSYVVYSDSWAKNGANNWTWTDIDNLVGDIRGLAGLGDKGVTISIICAQLYVEVSYIESTVIDVPLLAIDWGGVVPAASVYSGTTTDILINVPTLAINMILPIPVLMCSVVIDTPILEIDTGFFAPNFGGDIVIEVPVLEIDWGGLLLNIVNVSAHKLLKGRYFGTPIMLNRTYVVGIDNDGNPVYGSTDSVSGLEVSRTIIEPMASTTADAVKVSVNILAKERLDIDQGEITTIPNCGLEIGDVIRVTDSPCNQSNVDYRVKGIQILYNPRQEIYYQTVNLTAV